MSRLVRRTVLLAVLCSGSSWSSSYASALYFGCNGNNSGCVSVGYAGCCFGSCKCNTSGGTEICVCACCYVF